MTYTGKAYLYTQDGEVVVNKRPIPNKDPRFEKQFPKLEELSHLEELAEWKSQHIKVENVSHVCEDGQDFINYTWGKNDNFCSGWHELTEGITCELEGNKVTRLIQKI